MHPHLRYFSFLSFLGRNTKTKENTNKYVLFFMEMGEIK